MNNAEAKAAIVAPVKKRYDYLDAITALMLINMMISHTFGHGGIRHVDTFYTPVFDALFFFMPWFYFKAGIFIKHKKDLGNWIRDDFKRLLVPYTVFTAIGSVFYYAMELYTPDKPLWKILAMPFYQVITIGSASGGLSLWFLLSLFLSRLAFRVIPEKAEPYALVGAVVIGSALSYWDILLPFSLSTVFPGLTFILLGKYCSDYVKGDKLTKFNWGGQVVIPILWIVVYTCFEMGCNMRVNEVDGIYVLWVVGALLGCLSMVVICRPFVGKVKFLSFIGRHSMMYYVLHWPILYISAPIIKKLCPEIDPYTLTITLAVILILCLSLATWKRKWIPPVLLGE